MGLCDPRHSPLHSCTRLWILIYQIIYCKLKMISMKKVTHACEKSIVGFRYLNPHYTLAPYRAPTLWRIISAASNSAARFSNSASSVVAPASATLKFCCLRCRTMLREW